MKRSYQKRVAASMLMGAALALAATQTPAQKQRWDFQVFLDDAPIGYHRYALSEAGAVRELKSEARFDVKVLFFNAYRYAHDASERWRGNCLAGFTARTDDNGERSDVGAELQGERITVTTARGRDPVDGCLMSFAYWNPQMLRQTRLLNAQTGRVETVSITALGEENITVRGVSVPATRYRVSGPKHAIDLWYGADRTWLALQSTLDSGRRLRYQLK
jgi:hypothetical protein